MHVHFILIPAICDNRKQLKMLTMNIISLGKEKISIDQLYLHNEIHILGHVNN